MKKTMLRHDRCSLVLLTGLLSAACGGNPLVPVSDSASEGGTVGEDDTGSPTASTSGASMSTSGTSGTTGTSATMGTPTTTSGGNPTTSPSTTTGAAESGTAESGGIEATEGVSGFLVDPDVGGSIYECSLWDQNCPPGEKCMPWSNDGGNPWNASKCTPVAPDPDGPGEPCTVEGNGVSGIDTCEAGAMCWDADPKTNTGECVPFCIGSENNPQCADPARSCSIYADNTLILCLPNCDPLAQDCAAGQGCYFRNYGGGDRFTCAPDASGELGAAGDPCEFHNACDPGNACLPASALLGCSGASGCCTPFCDLSSPDCSVKGHSCVPYFEPGQAPPGDENAGYCGVPA